MGKQKSPYENKLFLYTEECAICGSAFPSDEPQLRGIVEAHGRELVVKQVSLFHGWRDEATSLKNRLGIEVPFYWDYNTDKAISWHDIYEKTGNRFKPVELNKEKLEEFLGGNNEKARKSEGSNSEEN